MSIQRYDIIPYRFYLHISGRRASIYSACPWTNEADKPNWKLVERGFTIFDNHTNTSGLGRPPFETLEAAQAFIDRFN